MTRAPAIHGAPRGLFLTPGLFEPVLAPFVFNLRDRHERARRNCFCICVLKTIAFVIREMRILAILRKRRIYTEITTGVEQV